jgi:hypothetical protein
LARGPPPPGPGLDGIGTGAVAAVTLASGPLYGRFGAGAF